MKSLIHHVKRHYHAHYRSKFAERAHWVFMFDSSLVLIILGLLAFGSYYAFFYHPLRDDFKINVFTEKPIQGAGEATVVVRMINDGKHALKEAKLTVHFPPQFLPLDDLGTDNANPVVEIGSLPAKASHENRFRGLFLGPAAEVPIFAHLTARTDDQSDERLVETRLKWSENLLRASLGLPDLVLSGQTVPVRFTLKNDSRQAFEKLALQFNLPQGFKISASSPPLVKNAAQIGPLAPGETVTVDLVGKYTGSASDLTFGADVFWIKNGAPILVASASEKRSFLSLNLNFTAGITDGGKALQPGSDIAYSISYKNEGPHVLKNVRFGLQQDLRFIDPAYSQTGFDPLAQIAPGENGVLNGAVRLRSSFSQYVTNAQLTLAPTATFSMDEPRISETTVSGVAATAKIAGQATLQAAARYFTDEGEQIGRGTLPPRVGKETRYWVFLNVLTGTNALSSATAQAFLPKGVSWAGKSSVTSGDQLTYDASRHALVWNIGDIDAHAGATSSAANASFEVSLTPTADQIGSSPALLIGSSFQAADAWTGEPLSAAQGAITTLLPMDRFVRGRTTVRP